MKNRFKNQWLTIPNILSIFRILLIPFIVWLYVFEDLYMEAGIVVIISGLTDIVDGYIARNFDQTSELGKVLDPVADKLTQGIVLLSVMTRFPYLIIPFVLFALKEISSAILYVIVYRRTDQIIGAQWHGKVNTVLLYTVIIIHIFFYNISWSLSILMVIIISFTMLLSLFLYVRLYTRVLKEHTNQ